MPKQLTTHFKEEEYGRYPVADEEIKKIMKTLKITRDQKR